MEKFREEVRRLTLRSYNLNQEVIKERARPAEPGGYLSCCQGMFNWPPG